MTDSSTAAPTVPIAIIGAACRFPGANSLEDYWTLLRDGRTGIAPLPESRWRATDYHDVEQPEGSPICFDEAGVVEGLEYFDAEFFGLTAHEASRLDPQQKLALEVTWHALESAGIVPESLSGTDATVIFGVGHSDHARKLKNDVPTIDRDVGPHCYDCFVANRLSYFLNLKGASFVVNSACSSSLLAIHLACRSLATGDSDLAISGGVNVHLLPEESISCTIAGWLARDAKCKSFREKGDGYVRGEGCGVVILKRLADAMRDGDPVRAVIRGGAIAHNGVSNGITVPNGASQGQVIDKALSAAGVSAKDISYVEAHGTGSSRGDSTEAAALIERLAEGRSAGDPCAIGCCKPNVGHLEAASGIAGLLKLLLCIENERLPRILHLDQLNRWIPQHEHFQFLTEDRAWQRDPSRARIALLSNFAFGGANAVMVVGEPPSRPTRSVDPASGASALVLRARSRGALDRLSKTICSRAAELCADTLYTLNCRRAELNERRVFIAPDVPSLRRDLVEQQPGRGIQTSDFPRQFYGARLALKFSGALLGENSLDPLTELASWAATGRILDEWILRFAPSSSRDNLRNLLTNQTSRRKFLCSYWLFFYRSLAPRKVRAIVVPEELRDVAVATWLLRPDVLDVQLDPKTRASAPVSVHLLEADGTFGETDAKLFVSLEREAPAPNTPEALTLSVRNHWNLDLATVEVLAKLHCLGVAIQWEYVTPGHKRFDVPRYPFEREWSWFVSSVKLSSRAAFAHEPPAYPAHWFPRR